MEQKQLDEIDESYFGDEFIDDENNDEIKIEKVESSKKKTSKKKTTTTKTAAKEVNSEEKKEMKIKESKKSEIEQPKKNEVTQKPIETSQPIDPWADEIDNEPGVFQEASTWKALTGLLVILLIFSVFTQGFNFSDDTKLIDSEALSLQDAETKAINFVNTNLLQPPFTAELSSSEELDSLYKVTLSVAGQEVDSYLTRDGKFFFPQGFDTSVGLPGMTDTSTENLDSVPVEEEDLVENDLMEEDESHLMEETTSESMEEVTEMEETKSEEAVTNTELDVVTPVEPEEVSIPEETEVVVEPAKTVELSLTAKKWLFLPEMVKVNQGDLVKLTINPVELEFTFAIPGLGVEQQVSGSTIVEFTADKKGEVNFVCKSCEEWRGMSGILVIE